MKRKQLYVLGAGALGILAVYLLCRASKSSSPPAVAGTLTSGGQSLQINDNVLSPGFGLPITE